VFDAAPMPYGYSQSLSRQNSELSEAKKIKMIFSNTAKTISSIEDKMPSFAQRLGLGGSR
jgi:hypothetical protein